MARISSARRPECEDPAPFVYAAFAHEVFPPDFGVRAAQRLVEFSVGPGAVASLSLGVVGVQGGSKEPICPQEVALHKF